MTPQILAQHMGQLHAYEQYIVFGVAFGPFLLLGLVVFLVRRRDIADDARETDESPADDAAAEETRAEETRA